MVRQLYERVDKLEATVDAILEEGVTANQRKAIDEAVNPSDGEESEDESEDE